MWLTRGGHEVLFVFPVLIVHDDDHLALADVFNGILDRVEGLDCSGMVQTDGGMARKAQICTMVLPVVAYGDPVLRKEAEDVEQNMEGLRELIDNMWETMYKAEGVGLAALADWPVASPLRRGWFSIRGRGRR